MSSGFSGSWADVVEAKVVNELCPEESKKLYDLLQGPGISFDRFCEVFRFAEPRAEELFDGLDHFDDEQERFDQISRAWLELQTAFGLRTSVCNSKLELMVGYHSGENGDCYDELDGGFFHVDGVYVRSPAGAQFAGMIERKHYVEYS